MKKIKIDFLKTGDSQAFQTLVEFHQQRVINICYRFLNNREDAEDAAQETFIEVYKSISQFREESTLSTWIYRIAVTKSLDLRKKKKRLKRYGGLYSILGIDSNEEIIPAPESDNPEIALENSERARILQESLNSLPENQKISLTLSQYEGFSNKEIALIMGTSVSSVESLIHRAKKKIHKILFKFYQR